MLAKFYNIVSRDAVAQACGRQQIQPCTSRLHMYQAPTQAMSLRSHRIKVCTTFGINAHMITLSTAPNIPVTNLIHLPWLDHRLSSTADPPI